MGLVKRGKKWYFRRMVNGKVHRVSLKTTDERIARARAKELEARLVLGQEVVPARKGAAATVGEVLERYLTAETLPSATRTRVAGARWLRLFVRQATGCSDPEAQTLEVVNVDNLRLVREQRLRQAGHDKMRRNTACVSLNSWWMQLKAIFGRAVRQSGLYNDLVIPACVDDFCRAPRLPELKVDSYTMPEPEVLERLFQAAEKLKEDDPQAWVAFWLSSQAGLRRSEIGAARWRWLGDTHLRVCFEHDFVPKGKRERNVPFAPAAREELVQVAQRNGWSLDPMARILPVDGPGLREHVFYRLGVWMKRQGWRRRQKAHELRKVYASLLTRSADAWAAQLALGHRSLNTTMRYAARPELKSIDVRAMVLPSAPTVSSAPAVPATPEAPAAPAVEASMI